MVASLLRAEGHQVFAPTLTGLGERVHLASPVVGLDVHVEDLVRTLAFEDLDDVMLVGHSYAALVISQAAVHVRARLRHLVYVDAGIPGDGQTGFDLLGPEATARLTAAAERDGDGWLIPPPDASRLGIEDPDSARWVQAHLVPHPLKTYTQPVSLKALDTTSLPRTLIVCTRERATPDGVGLVRLPTGHDAMVTAPVELAAVLSGLTVQQAGRAPC